MYGQLKTIFSSISRMHGGNAGKLLEKAMFSSLATLLERVLTQEKSKFV
jgi:hypothetical protein